ncbi:MAG: hypothetical protein ACYCOR_18425 [Acidobacteriaceae bacterium]
METRVIDPTLRKRGEGWGTRPVVFDACGINTDNGAIYENE